MALETNMFAHDLVSTPVPGHKILITGACGYIGSHFALLALLHGHKVVCLDNLVNSSIESLRRVAKITHRSFKFYKTDILDKKGLKKVFRRNKIWAVVHFAGLKSVNESIAESLTYYHNNVVGSAVLLQVMQKFRCKHIVFSSSATVYGEAKTSLISEDHPVSPINPYGRSKLMVEQMIADACKSDKNLNAAVLRYFNPTGAHESAFIGDNPLNPPNNLMPCVTQSMVNPAKKLYVYGTDYNTVDGTAVRDYIHVMDLVAGHLAALEKLKKDAPGCLIYNLGNGKGYSVIQLLNKMEEVTGKKISRICTDRRPGDAERVVADPNKAMTELSWTPTRGLPEMCESSWDFQEQNPKGYVAKETFVQKLLKNKTCRTIK